MAEAVGFERTARAKPGQKSKGWKRQNFCKYSIYKYSGRDGKPQSLPLHLLGYKL